MIDRSKFYGVIRGAFGSISQSQVDGFEAIFDAWEKRQLQDIRWLAYMLATTWHETARTMQAIEEYGKGRDRTYGKEDPNTKKSYYGRGLVQLTWSHNYKKMSSIIYGDESLYLHPELALDLNCAVEILFTGMTEGSFTGRKLLNYFNATRNDPVNARKIINGLDKAVMIAGYHKKFLEALKNQDLRPGL